MLGHADPQAYVHGRFPAEDGGTAVALFLRRVPVLMRAESGIIRLSGLHLRLLNAEKIGICRTKKRFKPLPHAGTDAVYIPRYEFHASPPYPLSCEKPPQAALPARESSAAADRSAHTG